jgi:hypothetical protein
VAPGCVLQSSRGRQDGSGTLGLAPELSRTARIKDLRLSWPGCVLRLLREVQDGSKRWTHTPGLPRPVRQSAVRNQRANQSPSGDRYHVAHDASVRIRPLSGGVVQALRPTPAAPQFSFGRRSAMAEYTPACGSHLSREVRYPCCAVTAHPPGRKARPRSCPATATSHAECGTVPSGVSAPPHSYGAVDDV